MFGDFYIIDVPASPVLIGYCGIPTQATVPGKFREIRWEIMGELQIDLCLADMLNIHLNGV